MTRSFLQLSDLNAAELTQVLERAAELKRLRGTPEHPRSLEGKSVALLFDKASTRTRISFEVGIYELGAHPVVLISKDTQLGRGEPLSDTARMLSGYVDAAVYRTFGHERLEELREHATIPIVNSLSDLYHPCQLLADLMTIRQARGASLENLKVAWIGDGNNMAHSWMMAAALTGIELRLACPEGFQPNKGVREKAEALGATSIRVLDDPKEAATGADVVTTDVWASMGQEKEAEVRKKAFAGYCVDDALMSAASSDAIFLHCLPAHRGEEVSASVIDGLQSKVWDEAENRLHTQKALLEFLLC